MGARGDLEAQDGMGDASYSPGSVPVTHARSQEWEGLGDGGGHGWWDWLLLLLRVLVIGLTVASLSVMLTAKQTAKIPFGSFFITKKADYTDVRAFRALVYTEAGVAGVMLLLLIIQLCAKSMWTSSVLRWFVFLLDQATTYALVAMAAASAEVAWIASKGEEAPRWNATCPVFGKFCDQVGISLGLAFAAVVLLLQISLVTGIRPIYLLADSGRFPSSTTPNKGSHQATEAGN